MNFNTMAYEGRVYQAGTHDCYGSFRDLFIEATGESIPDFARPESWWNHPDLNLVEDYFEAAGFQDTGLTANGARPLYVLLFAIAGSKINHIGLYLGRGRFFHHPHNGLSVVEQFTPKWKSRCVKVLAHENYSKHAESNLVRHLDAQPVVIKRKWVRN